MSHVSSTPLPARFVCAACGLVGEGAMYGDRWDRLPPGWLHQLVIEGGYDPAAENDQLDESARVIDDVYFTVACSPKCARTLQELQARAEQARGEMPT